MTPSSTTWHRRLGHPGRDVLAQLSRSTDVFVLGLLLSTSVMRASLVVMLDFLFLLLLPMRRMPLILFIVTCGHL